MSPPLPEPDPNNLRMSSGFSPFLQDSELLFVSEGPPLHRVHAFASEIVYDPILSTFTCHDGFSYDETKGICVESDVENPQFTYSQTNSTIYYNSTVPRTDSLTFVAKDLLAQSDPATITIEVINDDIAPQITSPFSFGGFTNSNGVTQNMAYGISNQQSIPIEILEQRFEFVSQIETLYKNYYEKQNGQLPEHKLNHLRENAILIAERTIPIPTENFNVDGNMAFPEIHDASVDVNENSLKYPEVSPLELIRNFFGISYEPEINEQLLKQSQNKNMSYDITSVQQTTDSCFPSITLDANSDGGLDVSSHEFLTLILKHLGAEDDFDSAPEC